MFSQELCEANCERLKTCFDEIEETKGDDECRGWINRILDAKLPLATFVERCHRGGRVTEYVGFLKGSFNFSLRYRFDDGGPDAIIRFPKPGHTATELCDEKVANEIQVMEFLRRHTTIPVPHVHHWGLTLNSPLELGPFIVMDFVEGVLLSTLLKQEDSNDLLLSPEVDRDLLDKVYYQIADYMLQLSRLQFQRIGAISKDSNSATWSVRQRPLTYNMNELVTVSGYAISQLPQSAFNSASHYFKSVAAEHLAHVSTQRNIADDMHTAKARFIARKQFEKLIPTYCIHDDGPFLLFCDDLRPSNMLIDPETWRITAVLDLEFTNAMPAQYTYDPPWWLLLSGPERWFEAGKSKEFNALYVPRMEQFLLALERTEKDSEQTCDLSTSRLSTLMRQSWESGRFWFDYAARKSFDLDIIYWGVLHKRNTAFEDLDDNTRHDMERLRA